MQTAGQYARRASVSNGRDLFQNDGSAARYLEAQEATLVPPGYDCSANFWSKLRQPR